MFRTQPPCIRLSTILVRISATNPTCLAAVLKNAIEWVYPEWKRKAACFVSYGSAGGARAVTTK
jgi:NAD(P)H-dependent FMN reductase